MNDLPSLYNWANNLDSLITANSVKIMKISFSGEICQGELEKVEKPSEQFKFYQCLARVYADIKKYNFSEKHIIAYCSAKLEGNPKIFDDFYSLLDQMLKQQQLTVSNQTLLFKALIVNKYFRCADTINIFRSETNQEKLIVDIQELEKGKP